MATSLALFCGLTLLAIGGMHLYWGCGGKRGAAKAIPTLPDGAPLFLPGPLACFAVGFGLIWCADYYLAIAVDFPLQLPFGKEKWMIWLLAAVFLARAVGDFRYVGFFKTVRSTEFGRLDSRYYSPLCLLLGLASAAIGWLR